MPRTNLKAQASLETKNEDLHIISARRDFQIPGNEVARYKKLIKESLSNECFVPSLDRAVTGAAHSRVIGHLRRSDVYVPSDFDSQLRLFENLGFKIRRGRVAREYRGNNPGWSVEGIIVFE